MVHSPLTTLATATTSEERELDDDPYVSRNAVDDDSPSFFATAPDGKWKVVLALADQAVTSGTNFLTLALVARLCIKSEVGLFHLALTLFGFVRTAQERMLSAPYLVFAHTPGTNSTRLLGSSLTHQLVFALVTMLLTFGAAFGFAATNAVPGMSDALMVLAVAIPFLLLRDHLRAVCTAHFKYLTALQMDICVCIVQIGGIVLLSRFDRLNIPIVICVLGVACLVPTACWVWLHRDQWQVRREDVRRDWTQNWAYSRWLVAARTIGIGGYYAVPWIVVSLMDKDSAGAFATTSGLVGLSMMFIMGINNFFQPRTVRAFHDHGVDRMFRMVFETIAVIGSTLALVTLMYFLAGGWLLGQIYGPSYASYGSVVTLLSLSMLTVSVSIACGNGLAALARPQGYFWGELSYAVVAIGSAPFLVGLWGLNGAAISLVVGGLVASLVQAVTLTRLVRSQRVESGGTF